VVSLPFSEAEAESRLLDGLAPETKAGAHIDDAWPAHCSPGRRWMDVVPQCKFTNIRAKALWHLPYGRRKTDPDVPKPQGSRYPRPSDNGGAGKRVAAF